MRNQLIKRRGFGKVERRVFCPCELCRLRFGRMLYNNYRSGNPLRSYRRYPRPPGFADTVLRYRPKPKTEPAKQRKRRAAKIAREER
jgi:hypothetical protein